MKSLVGVLAMGVLSFFAVRQHAVAQQPQPAAQAPRPSEGNGARLFYNNCSTCHGNSAVERAPSPATIKQMSPDRIYQALTAGSMQEMAKTLSDDDKLAIAEYMSGRKLGSGESASASSMQNRCSSTPALRDPNSGPSWNGWGVDLSNSRFQPGTVAKLSPGQVSRLRLKWAFGLPGATSLYGQPTVVGGRTYISSDAGHIYSLDSATGCVYWSFQAQAGVRSAITIGTPRAGSTRQLAYFGDVRGNAYAIDAANGELVWKNAVDTHHLARITAAPKLHDGRVYVPVASLEEPESGSPKYPCCTFRGSIAALNAETGKLIWKTYTIPDTPKVVRKTSTGSEYLGPSGAGVWNSPTIDVKRNALYFGTGNGFSDPPTKFSDAIMALDMATGKVLWSVQTHPYDIWHGGCVQAVPGRSPNARGPAPPRSPSEPPYPPEACPDKGAPDWDFSASPILTTRADGKALLIAGQKSGTVYALDVDRKGALVWSQDVARVLPGGGGEIVFGGAADNRRAYFNLRSGGMVALDLDTGEENWFTPFPPAEGQQRSRGASSAVTLIPGVVLSAGLDGVVRAFSAGNGQKIWEFNTDKEFETVNKVPAKGGSIGAGGPVVVDGTMYVGTGYIGFQGGTPGNVLLAFGTLE
ncbi:MAG: PQQ-binding-like beta-propeller repeat protein [Candidatus Korobacteraceae bacterium]